MHGPMNVKRVKIVTPAYASTTSLRRFRIFEKATISVRIRKILIFFYLFALSVCPSGYSHETTRLPLDCHLYWIFTKIYISDFFESLFIKVNFH